MSALETSPLTIWLTSNMKKRILIKKIGVVALLIVMQVTSLPVTVLAQEVTPLLEDKKEEPLVGGIELDPSQIILDQASKSGEVEVNLEQNGQASAYLKPQTIIRKLIRNDYT